MEKRIYAKCRKLYGFVENQRYNNLSRYVPTLGEHMLLSLGAKHRRKPRELKREEIKSVTDHWEMRNRRRLENDNGPITDLIMREARAEIAAAYRGRKRERTSHWGKHMENAAKRLKNNKGIVITMGDKGANLTITNTEDFKKSEREQLLNYDRLEGKPNLNEKVRRLKNIAERGKLEKRDIERITKKWVVREGTGKMETLAEDNTKIARLSIMPKKDFPKRARPVVRECASIFTPLAKWVNTRCFKYMREEESILLNSSELVKIIERNGKTEEKRFVKRDWIVTADIASLYTNVPPVSAIQSLWSRMLLDEDENNNMNVIADGVRNMLLHMVNNMYIVYDDDDEGEIYLKQRDGLAMGSACSGLLANLFLCDMEKEFLRRYKEELRLFQRYQDDIFMILDGDLTEEEVKNIVREYGRLHEKITLPEKSIQISKERVNFLDLEIRASDREERAFETNTYSKDTSSFLYITKWSNNPQREKEAAMMASNIQAIRNCSEEVVYEKEKSSIVQRFVERGFEKNKIEDVLKRHEYSKRSEFLEKKEEKEKDEDMLRVGMPYRSIALGKKIKGILKNAQGKLAQESGRAYKRVSFMDLATKNLLADLKK